MFTWAHVGQTWRSQYSSKVSRIILVPKDTVYYLAGISHHCWSPWINTDGHKTMQCGHWTITCLARPVDPTHALQTHSITSWNHKEAAQYLIDNWSPSFAGTVLCLNLTISPKLEPWLIRPHYTLPVLHAVNGGE